MVPSLPPSEREATGSEDYLWRALQDQLSDDYYVIHGLEFMTEAAFEGETDFLVLHRKWGLLNIECKGHGVYRDYNDQWWRTDPKTGQKQRMKKKPSAQARQQIRHVVERFFQEIRRFLPEEVHRFPLVYGWALAFPFASKLQANIPPDLQDRIVYDCTDMRGLAARIEDTYQFYHDRHGAGSRELTRDQLDAFVWEGIMAPFYTESTRASRLDYERERFVALSGRQLTVVNAICANSRVAVSGGAGTGKTIVAMKAAERLARRGQNVLVTCFNSALAEQLRRVASRWSDLEGEVHVDNFHGICVDAADGELEFPAGDATPQEHRDFWAERAPFALLQALDEGSYERGPWDAILVDEAQDFYHEWWSILEAGLRDPEQSKLALFYDARQTIFDHGSPRPPRGMFHQPLTQNFRNTQAICEVVEELGGIELVPHGDCPVGAPPAVYQQPGPTKARRMIEDLLGELRGRQGLAPQDIAILSPHSPRNSVLEAATRLGEHAIAHDAEQWLEGRGVLHASISAFKGMEADAIIMIDVDPDDPRCTREHRYVAASRARHRLYVFERGNWMA